MHSLESSKTSCFLKSLPSDLPDFCVIDRDKTNEELEKQEKRVIVCAFCGNAITDASHIISVNGSHNHIFANPHGIIFNVGCFKECGGCIVDPAASSEFSWFHGYNWRVSGCGRCRRHLGWFFLLDNSSDVYKNSPGTIYLTYKSFYCLILENIYSE